MEKFKVIKLSEYQEYLRDREKIKECNQLSERLSKLPKGTVRKVKILLEKLKEGGITYDNTGVVTNPPKEFSETFDILPFVTYAVQGKEKPTNWDLFLPLLKELKLPKDLLSTKAIKDAKKKRRS